MLTGVGGLAHATRHFGPLVLGLGALVGWYAWELPSTDAARRRERGLARRGAIARVKIDGAGRAALVDLERR